jgi:hypothetical protein
VAERNQAASHGENGAGDTSGSSPIASRCHLVARVHKLEPVRHYTESGDQRFALINLSEADCRDQIRESRFDHDVVRELRTPDYTEA